MRTVLFLALLLSIFCSPGQRLHAQAAESDPLGSWQRISLRTEFSLWDVTCTDSLHCVAVGDYGVIITSTDGGESWSQKLSPNQFALRNVHFFDDSSGIVAGFRGSCFLTTNRGGQWTAAKLPESVNRTVSLSFPGMCVVGDMVWLSGEEGTILRSTDRGVSWISLDSGSDVMIDAISFADARHGWATSVQRKVLHTTDGGISWREQPLETLFPIAAVCARSANECWIAGYHGLLMRTLDGGKSWEQVDAYETDYSAIAFDARGTGWAVGKRGAVVRGEEGNLHWRLHDLTTAKRLDAITFLPNNTAIAVGNDGMLFKHHELYPVTPSRLEKNKP